eukprot:GILK01003906.1.p1 GENE.GILK01003906.1~~GILK01003906.1.p1  ORF type:complete len:155 (-),score=24.43 GILK01003906.1:147-611(-)
MAIQVEREFNSSGEKVWRVWTEPEFVKQWWSPKHFTAPVIKMDFRENGSFLFAMQSPQGDTFWNTGTYREIVPLTRILSSMSFSDAEGRVVPGAQAPVPGEWPDEITVDVRFAETGGKTRVTIVETGVPQVMNQMASMGWQQQFDKLDALLASV